jgi:hypothetical protein
VIEPILKSAMSADLAEFWKTLEKRLKNGSLEIRKQELAQWKELWKVAALISIESPNSLILKLPKIMLSLAGTDDMLPKASDILGVFTNCVKYVGAGCRDVSVSLRVLESILDLVCHRLSQHIGVVDATCVDKAALLQVYFNQALIPLMSNIDVSNRVTGLLHEMAGLIPFKQHLDRELRKSESGETAAVVAPSNTPSYLLWKQRPTLEWLLSPAQWHDIGEGLKAEYVDAEEYSTTLLRVWTLLTFYWGCGAVFPRCWCKQNNDMACGQPLLAVNTSVNAVCRKCKRHGNCRWKCYRPNHDSVCDGCLRKTQNDLLGSPGSNGSSTDIYDGVVSQEHVRSGSAVFGLSKLNSRKPPKENVNWKTTYRLPEAGLVGIIRLGVAGEPLARDCPIYWAEIVSSNQSYGTAQTYHPEWVNRSRGEMCVRLLSAADCDGLPRESDLHLERGIQVAVVDLRVFVPEVITVLGTLSSNTYHSNMNHLPFIQSLIGQRRNNVVPRNDFLLSTATRDVLVLTALEDSNIDYVRRMSQSSKTLLAQQILGLKPVSSLYGTQLEAFVEAIRNDVHCAQGPPGTGNVLGRAVSCISMLLIHEVLCA